MGTVPAVAVAAGKEADPYVGRVCGSVRPGSVERALGH